MPNTLVCIKGAGDIASAIGHCLFTEGYSVALFEASAPTTPRRRMSFAQAVFDGEAELENVRAVRVDEVGALKQILERHEVIPIIVTERADLIQSLEADIVIDARMRKKEKPEIQIHQASFTIGLGPNFRAGQTTHLVVETNWGDRLGKIIYEGESEPYTGRPREIAGFAAERYTYAPGEGIWHTDLDIGRSVKTGDVLGSIDPLALRAQIDGIVRGITKDGLPVSTGTKLVDIDPRRDEQFIRGIAERPRRIAEAVVQAIREWQVHRTG